MKPDINLRIRQLDLFKCVETKPGEFVGPVGTIRFQTGKDDVQAFVGMQVRGVVELYKKSLQQFKCLFPGQVAGFDIFPVVGPQALVQSAQGH